MTYQGWPGTVCPHAMQTSVVTSTATATDLLLYTVGIITIMSTTFTTIVLYISATEHKIMIATDSKWWYSGQYVQTGMTITVLTITDQEVSRQTMSASMTQTSWEHTVLGGSSRTTLGACRSEISVHAVMMLLNLEP